MAETVKERGLLDFTLIIATVKHGQSPIDTHQVRRTPPDNPADNSPAKILGSLVAQ